jgi:hypothetical protein
MEKFPSGIRDWIDWRRKTQKERNLMYSDLLPGPKKAFLLNRRAQMDMLPIAADPAMWTDEQLMEIFQTPHLLETLQKDTSKLTKALEQAKKRGFKAQEFVPKDIGEWREHGWFMLHFGEFPVGFYNSKEQAHLGRRKLVDMFAKDGVILEDGKRVLSPIVTDWIDYDVDSILEREGVDSKKHFDTITRYNNKMVDEFFHHSFYEKRRRDLAEKLYGVSKTTGGYVPKRESVVTGAIPTSENVRSSSQEIIDDVLDEVVPVYRVAENVHKDIAEQVAKKIKIIDEGLDPEKMSNDGQMADSVLYADEKEIKVGDVVKAKEGFVIGLFEDSNVGVILKEKIKMGRKFYLVEPLDVKVEEGKMGQTTWVPEYAIELTDIKEELGKDAIKDFRSAVLNIEKKVNAHFVPEGPDDTEKFPDESHLWSGEGLDNFKSIKDFIKARRKETGQNANDAAYSAVKDFVNYWKLLQKGQKRRGKK